MSTPNNNGNPNNTSTDYVVANPDFTNEETSKVLAASSQDTSQPGAGQGPLVLGITAKHYGYYDCAGIWRETQQGHVVQNTSQAEVINVPASVYSVPVLNVGNRFMR